MKNHQGIMNSRHGQGRKDLTDITVLSTPQPRASSTTQKQSATKQLELKKVPFTYSPNTSIESLGILSLDNFQLTPGLNSADTSSVQPQFTNEKLQQQRALASSILEKTAKGLPSRYLKASDTQTFGSPTLTVESDSTVNESDLLQSYSKTVTPSKEEDILFTPEEISTPRSSCASNESCSSRTSIGKVSISESLAQLSEKIRNSDTSLAELCEQFSRLDSLNFSQTPEFNEESFVPGELAIEKIAEHERSWRREHDILGGNSLRSNFEFSQFENHNFSAQNRSSVTEFFRKKSELADLCLKDSPEKDTMPTPLIDNSLLFESIEQGQGITKSTESSITQNSNDSVLSITEIEKVIAANDNTARIMDYVFGKSGKTKPHEPEKMVQKTTLDRRKSCSLQVEDQSEFKENKRSCRSSCGGFKFQTSYAAPLKDSRNNISDKSSMTIHTASSLESLPGGKLPIESNRIELVWGCVPVGKKKTQTFILRNKSQNKLRLQLRSSNTCFKIVNDRSEADPLQVLPVLLYPAESRLFSVSFTPSMLGAVAEKISFTPINSELQLQQTKRQQLNLFGYGGYSNVEIQNVLKDTNMKMWLSLGKLEDPSVLIRKFTVRNVGTLAAFCSITFNSKALYGYSNVSVNPTEIVLKSKESRQIIVTYTPTKDDVKNAFATSTNEIMEIGSINVVSGEEPVRGRIRRLHRKLQKEGGVISNSLIERLSKKFDNEKMPSDLNKFGETVGCMKDLIQSLVSKEIILILERDIERTLMEQIVGIDESSMFHSLAEGMTTVIANPCIMGSCTVEPTTVLLTPPAKTEDNIILISHSVKPLQFQTALDKADMLEVVPSEGILSAGETMLLKISCDVKKIQQLQKLQQEVYKLSVYVDDDMFDVDVKIILVKSRIRK